MHYCNHTFRTIFSKRAEVNGLMAQDPQMVEMQQADPEQFQIMYDSEVAKELHR